jgi:hypothetical protein
VELKPTVEWEDGVLKAVVLNLTRAEALAELAGSPDMDQWPGTNVLVRRGWTRYQGKKVACIEFAAPPVGKTGSGSKKASPAPASTVDLGDAFEPPDDDGAAF